MLSWESLFSYSGNDVASRAIGRFSYISFPYPDVSTLLS